MKKRVNHKVRLNVRLPEDLVRWAKRHAQDSHTTVTQLIQDILSELKTKTESGQVDQF